MIWEVAVRPRVHIALCDMGRATSRAFGGIGFAVDGPSAVWRAVGVGHGAIRGVDHLDGSSLEDISDAVGRLAGSVGAVHFSAELVQAPPQHRGFGSKTMILLGLLEAINRAAKLGLSGDELIRFSGRGGASGVGVHLFRNGGIVWDGGHFVPSDEGLLPSGGRLSRSVPPLLARWEFPADWRVCFCLSEDAGISGEAERAFFSKHCPIPASDALAAIANACHEVIPAFATADLDALAAALKRTQSLGFKRREIENRSDHTRRLLERLQEVNASASGMSSMGPLIYVIYRARDEHVPRQVQVIADEFKASFMGPYLGWNAGRAVSELSIGAS